MGLICEEYASSCEILWRSVKTLLSYLDLTAFNMAVVRHLGFVIRVFGTPTKVFGGLVIMQNVFRIGAIVSIIC